MATHVWASDAEGGLSGPVLDDLDLQLSSASISIVSFKKNNQSGSDDDFMGIIWSRVVQRCNLMKKVERDLQSFY